MISTIQRSWRHSHMKFSNKSRNNRSCGARVSFRQPFIFNSLFASMLSGTGWVGGGAQTDFTPGSGNPRYAAGIRDSLWMSIFL